MKIHTDDELVYSVLATATGEYHKHIKSIPEQIKRFYLELNALPDLEKDENSPDNYEQNKEIENNKNVIQSKINNLSVQTLLIQNRIENLQKLLDFLAYPSPFDYFEVGYTFNDTATNIVNNLHLYPIVTIKDPKAAVVFRDIFGQQLILVDSEFRVPLEAMDSNAEFLIDNKLKSFKEFLKIKKEAIQERKSSFWYRTSEYERMSLEESMARADKELAVVNSLTEEEYTTLVSGLYLDLIKVLKLLK